MADELNEEKARVARARIPYAPPLAIDSRPAPKYTEAEVERGINMLEESEKKAEAETKAKQKAEEETKTERTARERAEKKALKRKFLTDGLRKSNTTYDVNSFIRAFYKEAKKKGKTVPKDKSTQALIDFLMEHPEIPVGRNKKEVQESIGAWAGVKLDQVGNGVSQLNTLTKAKLRSLLNKKDWMWKMTKKELIDILLDKMEDDESLADINKVENQIGGGNGETKEGLMTNDIDDIMKDEKTYAGTIPSDKLANLKIGGLRKYGFIMNTDPSTKPGIHWIAVWVDYDGDKTIEIYDPLAEYEPTQSFLKQIKDIVDNTKNLDHYLLLKTNKIKNQSDSTDTCGWHSIKFLKERAKGNRWKFASGYTDLEEKKIKQFKKNMAMGMIPSYRY